MDLNKFDEYSGRVERLHTMTMSSRSNNNIHLLIKDQIDFPYRGDKRHFLIIKTTQKAKYEVL